MPSGRSHGVWWLSPPGGVVLIVPVTLGLAAYFDDAHFRAAWGTPKALTQSTTILFAAGALVFVLGALQPMLRQPRNGPAAWPNFTPTQLTRLRRAADLLFPLTMLGYVALAGIGAARGATPASLFRALDEQNTFGSALRAQFEPVAGVTTLTQLGIAYVVVASLLLRHGRDARTVRRLVIVFVLALARTFFLAERLALIELIVPAVVVVSFSLASSPRHRSRVMVRLAPVLIVPAVGLFFSAFEYSRSWVFYSARTSGSFGAFILDRLAGYYATAYNNGQLALSNQPRTLGLPYGSVEALWTAPGLAQLDVYRRLTGISPTDTFAVIVAQQGNPEFNSPGGLAIPFVDYGTLGGLIFLFLAGLAVGFAYVRCRDGSGWAVLLYPVVVTGIFELPRYLYWGQGRVAPAIVALLVVNWYASRRAPLAAQSARPL
jgi:oligosaccharide repeat unit polymerase